MTPSFVVYIDESGDEGFTFHPDGKGSSRWLVLSAVVYRISNATAPVQALKAARDVLGMDAKKAFHFSEMKHDQRVVLMHQIAQTSFRSVSVISYKPHIPDPETYQANKNMLYRYLTRLLLERVSWFCRDMRKTGEGDGTAEIVFSDRASMSYVLLRGYVDLLRQQAANGGPVKIYWPSIVTAQIRAVAHTQLAGLQIADAVASSTYSAIRLNRYGMAEPAYVAPLKGHVYRHKGQCQGYGLKFVSKFDQLKIEMPHLNAAFQNW